MKFQIYKDTQGNYRWRLRDDNHELLAESAIGYVLKSDCTKCIDLVKNGILDAKIEDLLRKPQ